MDKQPAPAGLSVKDLQALMDWYREQTPGSPDWYSAIDHVVGVLLALEIARSQSKDTE